MSRLVETASAVDVVMDVDSASATRRRRERRLRQFLRHERLSVAMALSEKRHHTSRGQRKDRARGYEMPFMPKFRPGLFGLYEEEPCGSRSPCLGEPRGPQVRVQRHTVEHIVDVCPFVQILDVPVPHLGNQLVEFMQRPDTSTPVQVIAVPKISLDRIPQRFVDRRRPWRAEQLVEVPTVVSFSSLQQQSAEQNIDIPVPGTRGDRGGLQGFRPRQGSQRTVEQIVDILAGEGLQGFLPILVWQPHPQFRVMRCFIGFFRFQKSAQSAGRSSARVHGHSSSWTPAASEAEESLSAFEFEYILYNDVCLARQWVPARRGYAWWIIDDRDGSFEGAVWRVPWAM